MIWLIPFFEAVLEPVENRFHDLIAGLRSNFLTIYDYYHTTKGYEVWALTITPKDDDNSTRNRIRSTVNVWIKSTASNVDRVIDAFTAITDPQDTTKRLAAFVDPNTPNHMNDAGLAAIVRLFP